MNAQTAQAEPETDGWEWAVVEVMGHRSHAGRIREEEKFGAKMLRIDVPNEGDAAKGWVTHLYAAGAIFSLRYSDEASVMKANKPYVSPYRLTYREETGGDGDDSSQTATAEQDDERPF